MAFSPVFQRPFSATFDRRAAAAPVPWYLAGGIPAENCLEHVELPSIGQSYAGATVAGGAAFTIAFRTTNSSDTSYVLDFNGIEGRIAVGYVPQNGFLESLWYGAQTVPLFADGDHVYFLVRHATTGAQFYRDNVAVGSAYNMYFVSGIGKSNGARWRSMYGNPAVNQWTPAIPGAAVYNIALDNTQRAGLYTAIAAL